MPMPVRRVLCHEAVEANRGRVALMCGPLVYYVEGVDNDGQVILGYPITHSPRFFSTRSYC